MSGYKLQCFDISYNYTVFLYSNKTALILQLKDHVILPILIKNKAAAWKWPLVGWSLWGQHTQIHITSTKLTSQQLYGAQTHLVWYTFQPLCNQVCEVWLP